MAADYPAAMNPVSSKLASNVNPVVVASAATLVNPLTYFVTNISGTAAMTGVQVPSGFRGIVAIIPAGACTGVTGGTYASDGTTDSIPFGKAFTAVAQRALLFVIDGLLAYPIA